MPTSLILPSGILLAETLEGHTIPSSP